MYFIPQVNKQAVPRVKNKRPRTAFETRKVVSKTVGKCVYSVYSVMGKKIIVYLVCLGVKDQSEKIFCLKCLTKNYIVHL